VKRPQAATRFYGGAAKSMPMPRGRECGPRAINRCAGVRPDSAKAKGADAPAGV
jgi:hypothetical protein